MDENLGSRTARMLGRDAVDALASKRVAVFGLGGVGGMAAEAIARAGIGHMVLVDADRVSPSNLNRQIVALHSTLGRLKVDVMRDRLLDINPGIVLETHAVFIPATGSGGLVRGCDYVVDAIDTVPSKVGLILECLREGVPVISCMGAGNKLDPTRFEIADLYETSVCPLCRVMRHALRKEGVTSLPVVYSKEPPFENPNSGPEDSDEPEYDPSADIAPTTKRRPPGSVPFVPPAAGLAAAGHVIRALTTTAR